MKGNDQHIGNIDDLVHHVAQGKTFLSDRIPENVSPAIMCFFKKFPIYEKKIYVAIEQMIDCMVKSDPKTHEFVKRNGKDYVDFKSKISHGKQQLTTDVSFVCDDNTLYFTLNDGNNKMNYAMFYNEDGRAMFVQNESDGEKPIIEITVYNSNGQVAEEVKAYSMDTFQGVRYCVEKSFPQEGINEKTVVYKGPDNSRQIDYRFACKDFYTSYLGTERAMFMDEKLPKEQSKELFEAKRVVSILEGKNNVFSKTVDHIAMEGMEALQV